MELEVFIGIIIAIVALAAYQRHRDRAQAHLCRTMTFDQERMIDDMEEGENFLEEEARERSLGLNTGCGKYGHLYDM